MPLLGLWLRLLAANGRGDGDGMRSSATERMTDGFAVPPPPLPPVDGDGLTGTVVVGGDLAVASKASSAVSDEDDVDVVDVAEAGDAAAESGDDRRSSCCCAAAPLPFTYGCIACCE